MSIWDEHRKELVAMTDRQLMAEVISDADAWSGPFFPGDGTASIRMNRTLWEELVKRAGALVPLADDQGKYEVSLPDPNRPGLFEPVPDRALSQEQALKIARDVWGADENGWIRIVNRLPEEEPCDDC